MYQPPGGLLRRRDLSNDKAGAFERSAFNKLLQASESVIPLLRNEVEVAARILEPLLIQLPKAFASTPRAAHKTGVLHHAQVFGDGLTRDASACSKPADGCRSFLTKADHQP